MANWITENTKGSKSVVELGAGFFDKLALVDKDVPTVIGIEIWQPYIDAAKYKDCIMIQGDILKYRKLLKGYDLDTVMVIDVLEHFDKITGYKLMEDLKKDFNKILFFVPIGKYDQNEDYTGYGAHTYQTHRAYYFKKDMEKLGFEGMYFPKYHASPERLAKKQDTSAFFGVWTKKNLK